MGLDTSHECWHGAYSAFSRWRNKLAEVAGYKLISRDGGYVFPDIDWDHLEEGSLVGDWSKTPEDPLLVLIAHSDCDGVIHPEQAGPLADRLEELIPLLPDTEGWGHIGDWKSKTRTFVDGLRAAVSLGEDVEFH